ncbi:hypothetical protein CDL15_Pgr023964 [Punica granatum]|uniref:Disease resistance protein Roq1-like winged-helix domain-containing protein n=1 Tax=Punica granatum TaxID=22663 RepID=A0A218WW11_PUNGR|nr:hypothetical protein CDL15_Pgr023964 [Punica granatum]
MEMGTLNPNDALQLFSRYVLENESPSQAFRELSVEAVSRTGGLPLALVVIGSLFHQYKDPRVWKDIIERSLVKILDNDQIWMHDQLRDLGRDIVLEDSLNGPKKCTRIWMHGEAILVLKGCYCLAAIDSSISNLKCLSFPKSIHNLVKLKCVKLNNLELGNLTESLGALSSLVELDQKGTAIINLPDAIGGLLELEKLSLESCKRISKLPRALWALRSLVYLDLSYSGLHELPSGIGGLKKLQYLRLSGCVEIKKLPDSLGELKLLVELDLKGTSIAELPNQLEAWKI